MTKHAMHLEKDKIAQGCFLDLSTSLDEVPIANEIGHRNGKKIEKAFAGGDDDGTKSKYMDRHPTRKHKIIRPFMAWPI